MSQRYTAGWITVPGKGRRWRTSDGTYMMQRPAGDATPAARSIMGAVQGAWSRADRAVGGWLPGGGTANPLSGVVRSSAAAVAGSVPTVPKIAATATSGWRAADRAVGGLLPAGGVAGPLTPAARATVNTAGNTFQRGRDAAMDAVKLPLPERLMLTAVTGGTRDGRPFDLLTPDQIAAIKGEQQKKDETVDRMSRNPSVQVEDLEQLRSSVNLFGYGSGNRDVHLGLGTFGGQRMPNGDFRVFDTWKVDKSRGDSATFKKDLMEGGNVPQLVFEGARRLGLVRPVEIDATIPRAQWEQTQARPGRLAYGEPPPEYMQGPQYEIGAQGIFFQGRNVAPWGYGRSGPLGRQDPAQSIQNLEIQKMTPEELDKLIKSFPPKQAKPAPAGLNAQPELW